MPRMPNIYLEAQYQQRLWSPAVLRPTVWLDAADISTISIATGVSEWRDKSNNGWNVVQATAGNQPTYTMMGLNGLNVVTFGTNRVLLTAANFTLTGDPNFSCFCVYRKTSSADGSAFGWGITDSGAGNGAGFYDDGALVLAGNGGGAAYGLTLQSPVLNQYSVNSWIKPAGSIANSTFFRNGANAVISAGSNAPNISSAPLAIGRYGNYTPNALVGGSVAELIIVNSASSPVERFAAEGYLSWKWGIRLAADHPFFSRPPLIGD